MDPLGLEGEENDGSGGDGDQPPANELKIVDVTAEGPSSKMSAMEPSLKLSLDAARAPTQKAQISESIEEKLPDPVYNDDYDFTTPNTFTNQLILGVRPEKQMVNPTGKGLRSDDGGSGKFGADRKTGDGDVRPHYGIDLLAKEGQTVLAPVSGRAVYGDYDDGKKPMVTIYVSEGVNSNVEIVQMMYLEKPKGISSGDKKELRAGEVIGKAADLSLWYSEKVSDHIHIVIGTDKDNNYRLSNEEKSNPAPYFFYHK